MKGIVLAAGAGRRLRPYTDNLPKTLIPVDGDLTILDIGLRNLAISGITDIAVVVGYRADAVQARQARLENTHGVHLQFVHNDKAEQWNNCYSLWLAREHLAGGAMLVNGDTVHPPSVEKALLAHRGGGVVLAVDTVKALADEEMKVRVDGDARLTRITKQMAPEEAHGEYIGATLIEPGAVDPLVDALERTWRRDPDLYYEDGSQTYVDDGGIVTTAPIGAVEWVEVDNHADLTKARAIACRC